MATVIQSEREVLSRDQAAQFLGICLTTLDRTNIPKIKVRRRVLYRREALIGWLAAQEQNGAVR